MGALLSGITLTSRQRVSVLLATLLLTILQVVAATHLISHSAGGDNGGCELCLSATSGGNAMVAAATVLPVFHQQAGRLVIVTKRPVYSRTPAVYRARGPPSFA
jgi:hypothetical protein